MCAINNFIEKNNVTLKSIVLILGLISLIIGAIYTTAFFVAKNNLKYKNTEDNLVLIKANDKRISTVELSVVKIGTNQEHLMTGQTEIKRLLRR